MAPLHDPYAYWPRASRGLTGPCPCPCVLVLVLVLVRVRVRARVRVRVFALTAAGTAWHQLSADVVCSVCKDQILVCEACRVACKERAAAKAAGAAEAAEAASGNAGADADAEATPESASKRAKHRQAGAVAGTAGTPAGYAAEAGPAPSTCGNPSNLADQPTPPTPGTSTAASTGLGPASVSTLASTGSAHSLASQAPHPTSKRGVKKAKGGVNFNLRLMAEKQVGNEGLGWVAAGHGQMRASFEVPLSSFFLSRACCVPVSQSEYRRPRAQCVLILC